MGIVKGNDAIIQTISCRNGRLRIVELGRCRFGVRVNEGLLVNPAYTFDMSDIKGVLGATVTGMFALKFAVRLLLLLGFFERLDLCFG